MITNGSFVGMRMTGGDACAGGYARNVEVRLLKKKSFLSVVSGCDDFSIDYRRDYP
jgi:hypothetical protein